MNWRERLKTKRTEKQIIEGEKKDKVNIQKIGKAEKKKGRNAKPKRTQN